MLRIQADGRCPTMKAISPLLFIFFQDSGRHFLCLLLCFSISFRFPLPFPLVFMLFHGALLALFLMPRCSCLVFPLVFYAMDQARLDDCARVELLATKLTYEARLFSLFLSASVEDARRPRVDSLHLPSRRQCTPSCCGMHACVVRSALRSSTGAPLLETDRSIGCLSGFRSSSAIAGEPSRALGW